MVHFNIQHDAPYITNHPHQHAFVIVGHSVHFGVHMTQYHCEIHKYQIIVRFGFPKSVRDRLRQLRREFPSDSFVLCNAQANPATGITEMTIPELASGDRSEFTGNIFQGFRTIAEGEEPGEHFFPWSLDRCRPAIADVPVTIERVVMFRPFAHHEVQPTHPSAFLWGNDDETHLTNFQTARLASGPYDPRTYGPDIDMVLSLKHAPNWLDPALLKAGIVVSLPQIDLTAPENWPTGPIFAENADIQTLYRGLPPVRMAKAGPTFLTATAICNSPETDPHDGENLYMTDMPPIYYVD